MYKYNKLNVSRVNIKLINMFFNNTGAVQPAIETPFSTRFVLTPKLIQVFLCRSVLTVFYSVYTHAHCKSYLVRMLIAR